MPNTSTIAFALIAGFIVFITVRGELPAYLCVIGLGGNCAAPPVDTTDQTQAPASGGTTTSSPSAPSSGGSSSSPIFSNFGIGNNGNPPSNPPSNQTPQSTCPPGYTTDSNGGCSQTTISFPDSGGNSTDGGDYGGDFGAPGFSESLLRRIL